MPDRGRSYPPRTLADFQVSTQAEVDAFQQESDALVADLRAELAPPGGSAGPIPSLVASLKAAVSGFQSKVHFEDIGQKSQEKGDAFPRIISLFSPVDARSIDAIKH